MGLVAASPCVCIEEKAPAQGTDTDWAGWGGDLKAHLIPARDQLHPPRVPSSSTSSAFPMQGSCGWIEKALAEPPHGQSRPMVSGGSKGRTSRAAQKSLSSKEWTLAWETRFAWAQESILSHRAQEDERRQCHRSTWSTCHKVGAGSTFPSNIWYLDKTPHTLEPFLLAFCFKEITGSLQVTSHFHHLKLSKVISQPHQGSRGLICPCTEGQREAGMPEVASAR